MRFVVGACVAMFFALVNLAVRTGGPGLTLDDARYDV